MLSVSCILLILYKMRQYHQIKKKFKNKKFAAKIDCNHILDGCTLTGITFDEAIEGCIKGLQLNAHACGLVGDEK